MSGQDNVSTFPALVNQAVDKLGQEEAAFSGGLREQAIHKAVVATLKKFCEEDARFAQVFLKTRRTLSDCCGQIVRGVGNSISDIEVYRRAVQFYFPNSEIEFKMNILLTGEAPSEEEMAREPEKKQPPKPRKVKKIKAAAPPEPKEKTSRPVPPPKPDAPEIIQLSLF